MVKLAVFDMDGTLLDTLEDLATAGNLAMAELGFPRRPAAEVEAGIGHGPVALMRSLLPEAARDEATVEAALAAFRRHYAAHCNDATRPYPGVTALLENLKKAGVARAVLSNKGDDFVKRMAARHFPGLLDEAVGFQAGVPPKPDPAALWRLMEKHGAAPEATLYIGDMDVDRATAENAGVRLAAVAWGLGGEGLDPGPAGVLVRTAEELQRVILDS